MPVLWLTVVRRKKGLTQAQLGERARIRASDISALERGWRKPYPAWKQRLAGALDVAPERADWLFEQIHEDAEVPA